MKTTKNLNTWLAMSMFLLSMVSTAVAQTIYVDDEATGANNGSSWADAYNYLQDALAAASSGDEIWLAQGTYTPDSSSANPNGSGQHTATFQLINGVAIRGGYAGFGEPDPNNRDVELYETVLSGDLSGNDVAVEYPKGLSNEPTRSDNSYNVVKGRETDGTAVVDGFTITGGNYIAISLLPFGGGGGMYNDYASSPTVTNCTFSGNSSIMYGGGMCNEGNSNPTLTNCVFSGNYASYGGGMRNYRSSPTLTNCTFRGNAAHLDGGMLNGQSSPTLTNCTFSKNSGDYGCALSNHDGSNSIVTNCILWGGTPQEIRVDALSMPVITYSDVKGGWPGEGNIDADPCFADAANGDYHLKSQAGRWEPSSASWVQDAVTSPCIDAGDMASPIGYEPFPNGGRVNMGAYGGTAEASKSYFGTTPCKTVVAGDINGDCKVNFKDFAFMALHWLEDNTPVSAVTTTYLFQPDPNALRTSGGFTGQGHGSYCVEGQFELTVDFCAGVAWFNRVDANTSCGEPTYTVSLDALFHMSELVSTDVSEAAIDFVFEKNIPSFPGADVHLQVIFLDGSVQLVGSVCDAICDGYCYHLDAVAVAEP